MSPREIFQRNPHAEAWAKIVEGLPFEEATTAALLEMQAKLCELHPKIDDASTFFYQLEGAQRFLQILSNLTKRPLPQPKEPIGQLKHGLK